jgi:hypothetical protein
VALGTAAGEGLGSGARHTGAVVGADGSGAGAEAGGRAVGGPKIGELGGGVVATNLGAGAFAGPAGRRFGGRGPLRDIARAAPSAPNAATRRR